MKKEIALALHEIGAIKFGEFTLKSGIKSPIYIDLRLLISYPKVLKMISKAMIELAEGLEFDVIAGIPYTALPIATAISIEKDWPMVYARKEVKDYGIKKKIEGVFKEGDTALIIDDLITTGGSDYHGLDESAETIIGGIDVPIESVEQLMALAEQRRIKLASP